MQKIISVFLLLCLSGSLLAQEASIIKEQLLLRSKHQKTAGFVLLGAGAILIALTGGKDESFGEAAFAGILGGAAVVGSIPLFLASIRNKQKAMRMSTSLQWKRFPGLPSGKQWLSGGPAVTVRLGF